MNEYVYQLLDKPDDDGCIGIFKKRIVRCQDCKYSKEEGIETECWFCINDRWNILPTMGVPIEPDGFCAWSKWRGEWVST